MDIICIFLAWIFIIPLAIGATLYHGEPLPILFMRGIKWVIAFIIAVITIIFIFS